MQAKIFLGIAVALVFLLQGCGHKGPLKLPAPKTASPQDQTPSSQTADGQKSSEPAPQPGPLSK